MLLFNFCLLSIYCILYANCAIGAYLVVLKPHETVGSFLKYDLKFPIAQRVRDKITKSFTIGTFAGFSGNFSESALKRLQRCPMVAEITPDIVVKALDLKEQKHSPVHLVKLSQADHYNSKRDSFYYDDDAAGQNVNVYVIDSGIETTHSEFEKRAFPGKDFTGEGSGDTNGHGTHVAGIVGSKTYGVAKNVNLYEVKTLDKLGQGTLSIILSAIEYAVNHRQKSLVPGVANLSLGAVKNNVLNRVINAACDTGLVVVVAAGNLNIDACSTLPASSEKAITVGAIDDSTLGIADFSNWGECVDILASGVSIASVDITNLQHPHFLSGTSMSAPIVTGLVATMLSQGISPFDVKDKLLNMAIKDAMSWRSLRGKGQTPNLIAYNGLDPEELDSDSGSESDDEDSE